MSAAFPEILSGVYDETEVFTPADVKVLPVSTEDGNPATEQQVNILKALGVDTKEIATFGQAKQAILEASQKKRGAKK